MRHIFYSIDFKEELFVFIVFQRLDLVVHFGTALDGVFDGASGGLFGQFSEETADRVVHLVNDALSVHKEETDEASGK